MTETERYEAAWLDLRSRRRLILLSIFLYPIAAAVIVVALAAISPSVANQAAEWAVWGWLAALTGANLYRAIFKCPRCHNLFFWRPLLANAFAGECLSCGLRKGAPDGSKP